LLDRLSTAILCWGRTLAHRGWYRSGIGVLLARRAGQQMLDVVDPQLADVHAAEYRVRCGAATVVRVVGSWQACGRRGYAPGGVEVGKQIDEQIVLSWMPEASVYATIRTGTRGVHISMLKERPGGPGSLDGVVSEWPEEH